MPRTPQTVRTESLTFERLATAIKDAYAAGGAEARHTIDTLAARLNEAHEIIASRDVFIVELQKNFDAVIGKVAAVAEKTTELVLAQGKSELDLRRAEASQATQTELLAILKDAAPKAVAALGAAKNPIPAEIRGILDRLLSTEDVIAACVRAVGADDFGRFTEWIVRLQKGA